ncbi:pyridine nucleotide-disulfide oxidoreductase [Dethiosulfatarculus sandiegensis]|uniref:Dihydrolipoyl dehydrogenase n=1 Tax=Dethiosulfatarculus sandiegensis TaxID=1429043 RepID=A0A0D2HJA4_9BACT|nr:pyridine nucleotide-disulfide oxidoreductase [Dethiosulfatarculus sandiegensis]
MLGGGPGGYTAALRAASLDAKVALVEKENLGGTCLNWGCIPTKALLKSSKLFEEINKASFYGIEVSGIKADLKAMVARKDKVVEQLRTGVQKLMEKRKIDIYQGLGRLSGPDKVTVQNTDGEQEIDARFVILATGAGVRELPGLPFDNKHIMGVRPLLDITEIPQSILVVGAGVIGLEMAQFLSGLGVKVTLVELLKSPIQGMLDPEIEKTLVRGFKKRKYKMHFGDSVESAEVTSDGVVAKLASGKEVSADLMLVAVGQIPASRDLGLEEAGVAVDKRGFITVDEHCRTNLDTVYAIGDVTGRLPLAHMAAHMGLTAVGHALGNDKAIVNESNVPKAVFVDPELAWVGLTEKQAAEKYGDLTIGRFLTRGLGRATAEGKLDGLVKIICRAEDQVVVGVHILSPEASALVAEAALAVNQGLTLSQLAETVHAHPTYPELIAEAAEEGLGLPIHG